MTRLTLDTNILFYAFDYSDKAKQRIASHTLDALFAKRAVLALQCLSEFYRAATRKRLATAPRAAELIRTLQQGLDVVPLETADLDLAMRLHQQHGFQFFDCLLAATVARAGCTHLFSEDFQHRYSIAGVLVLNPFLLSPAELSALLG